MSRLFLAFATVIFLTIAVLCKHELTVYPDPTLAWLAIIALICGTITTIWALEPE